MVNKPYENVSIELKENYDLQELKEVLNEEGEPVPFENMGNLVIKLPFPWCEIITFSFSSFLIAFLTEYREILFFSMMTHTDICMYNRDISL